MVAFSGDETAPFFGFLGAAAALVFSCTWWFPPPPLFYFLEFGAFVFFCSDLPRSGASVAQLLVDSLYMLNARLLRIGFSIQSARIGLVRREPG
jgi:hypothetical protein